MKNIRKKIYDIIEVSEDHSSNSWKFDVFLTIGMERAKAKIGLMNIIYNICRCTPLIKIISIG
ncbi:MAG: hypothetical protein M3512_07760 [Bacteroidota bacterium]|nr:hypothetical protein [Bacteroidota bacterium]